MKIKEFIKTPEWLAVLYAIFICVVGITLNAKKEWLDALGTILAILGLILSCLLNLTLKYRKDNEELRKIVEDTSKTLREFKEHIEKSFIITRL